MERRVTREIGVCVAFTARSGLSQRNVRDIALSYANGHASH